MENVGHGRQHCRGPMHGHGRCHGQAPLQPPSEELQDEFED